MSLGVEIERLPGLLKRFRTLDFMERPAQTFLRDWGHEMLDEIEANAPVFSGELRDSFTLEVGPGRFPKWARVVSNSKKARWLEYGTGALSEDPQSAGESYFPPVNALRDWSSAKGLDPFVVARGIFDRGGTPPTHFISNSAENVNSRLGDRVGKFGKMIEAEASHG